MRLLLDTHVLIWCAAGSLQLSAAAREAVEEASNEVIFSVASIWEMAIKFSRGNPDFDVPPQRLRMRSLEEGLAELPILAGHALAVPALPPIHGDPFDRLLAAQASVEGVTLVTADAALQQYPVAILRA